MAGIGDCFCKVDKAGIDAQGFKFVQPLLRIRRMFIVVGNNLVIGRDNLIEQHGLVFIGNNIVCPGGPQIVHGNHAVTAIFFVVNNDVVKRY